MYTKGNLCVFQKCFMSYFNFSRSVSFTSVIIKEWWEDWVMFISTERRADTDIHVCTHTNSTHRGPLPGDIVWWASRDAGFNGVGAIHTHCVKGLVVTVPKGIEVDVGLGSCSGSRLTWKHAHRKKEKTASVVTNDTYSSFACVHSWVVPVCVTPSGTAVCPDGFNFGSQSPATVKRFYTFSFFFKKKKVSK